MSSDQLVFERLVFDKGDSTRLAGVVICSSDLDHDIGVFSAITGATSQLMTHRNPGVPEASVFLIGDARLSIAGSTEGEHAVQRGIERLVIEVADLEVTAQALDSAGANIERYENILLISRQWAGVMIEVRPRMIGDDNGFSAVDVVLDHVAILVDDVTAMAHRWAVITGGPSAHSGVHPLGTSIAARFLLGDKMIELLAPLPDLVSPLRTRLDRFGPGPLALALIAHDIDATVAAVSVVGARLIDQPPHIIVHPSDASGVPIQLTPRVQH